MMQDCHTDMRAFHDQLVKLTGDQREEMRERRDANRRRLAAGLQRDGEPSPDRLKSQGSYAMRTMVQQENKDYDIDDGVYFFEKVLQGPRGGERTPAEVKEMVRKAVHDAAFKKPPEVRTNCVRVYYDAGYHVDLPVYRIVEEADSGSATGRLELASAEWRESDPDSVTDWFNTANADRSPDTENGGQLRRVTRLLKYFARSRSSWKERMAAGFTITKLVVECYEPDETREDESLHRTMEQLRKRLNVSLEVDHPTVADEKLTKGPSDASTRFLREQLSIALEVLSVLFDPECTLADARAAWDQVFNTDFFGKRPDGDGDGENGSGGGLSASLLIQGAEERAARDAVDKRGGGRYA